MVVVLVMLSSFRRHVLCAGYMSVQAHRWQKIQACSFHIVKGTSN